MTVQEGESLKLDKGTYDLINGDFLPDEAAEIVNGFFSKKINFQEVKSFSQLIQFGSKDPDTLQRISDLKTAQEKANALFAKAKETGREVHIHSTLFIELI